MDILKRIGFVGSIGRFLLLSILVLNLVSLANAQGASVTAAMSGLCTIVQSFLGIAAMMLIVLSGVVYAAGQVLGAETRARASVWATAMLTGAVIGILIYLIVPGIIATMLNQPLGTNPCTFGGGTGGGTGGGQGGGMKIVPPLNPGIG